MKKNLLLFFACYLLHINISRSQTDPLLYTYTNNTLAINPAYAGSNGIAQLQVINRRQTFTQLGGSASTYISYNTPLGKKANSFLGLQAYNSAGGVNALSGNGLSASSGYRHYLDNNVTLGLAIQYNLIQKINTISSLSNVRYASAIGGGIYAQNSKSILGIAKPFLSKKNQFGFINPIYLQAGHLFPLKEKIMLKAGALYETTARNYDLHAHLWFNQKYNLGLHYNTLGSEERTDQAIILLAESQLNKKFRLGLSYDFAARNATQNRGNVPTTNKQIYGLFQLNLKLEFDNQTGKFESFRYF
jgi:type IX secretion system PorP/SprF family membrane protein